MDFLFKSNIVNTTNGVCVFVRIINYITYLHHILYTYIQILLGKHKHVRSEKK